MFRATLAATSVLMVLSLPAVAQDAQPSFDCAKASAPIEHAICSDAALAKLDADLTALYVGELARIADSNGLRGEQRAWASERANACAILPGADDDVPDFSTNQIGCLKKLYTLRIAALSAVVPVKGVTPQATAQLLNGLWQIAEIVDAADPVLKNSTQAGRIIRLDRHGLIGLGGGGCAGPTLEALSAARARPLDADEQALLTKADKLGIALQGEEGIAGLCLGRLFALYIPTSNGMLLVADANAIYRLQRLNVTP